MLRLRAPGCEPAVGPAFETVAGQLGALPGNLRHELLRDALDPRASSSSPSGPTTRRCARTGGGRWRPAWPTCSGR
ncbi:hypothetical protein V2I01_34530 [Micromonospora sp. BRA006-A]|nr:hypothetical protein [Micromonospora sp. BRA006-A]